MSARDRLRNWANTSSGSAPASVPAPARVTSPAPTSAASPTRSRLRNWATSQGPEATSSSAPSPEAPASVTAAVAEGGASPFNFEQFLKVVGLLDRPRNAYFTGFNAYDQAVKRGDLPASNKYVPLGALSSALFSKQFWQGAKRGLVGEERYTGADVIKSDFPQFAEKHPTATQWLGAVTEISGDPLVLGGSATAKPAGAILQAGADAALGHPGATRMVAELAGPAVQRLGQLARPYVRFGAPSAVGRFLRQSRAGISTAGKEGAEEALALGDNLTPEMEREARRLLERPISAEVRARLAAKTGGKVPSAVDVALSEAQEGAEQAARASVRPVRRFRPINPAEETLDNVVTSAQDLAARREAQAFSVQPPRRFRPVNMAERRMNEVVEAAKAQDQVLAQRARSFLAESFGADEVAKLSDEEAVRLLLDSQNSITNLRKARRFLGDFGGVTSSELSRMGDAEAFQLATELMQAGGRPDEVQRVFRAAQARGMDLSTLLEQQGQSPLDSLYRTAERNRLARAAGVDTSPLPSVARPDTLRPRGLGAMDFVREAAERQGLNADQLFQEASERPADRIRRLGERARLGRVAGVSPEAPTLSRPGTIVPNVQADPEEAVRLLMERGVPEPAARAAVRGRGLTNRIVQEAQEEGLPLEGRGGYFPRVQEPPKTIKGRVTQFAERLKSMVGGRDPHAEARTLAPDLGIEELAWLKEQGADIPSYRKDFAIPLAVRNQRAKEALAAHKSIREGFQRFGQGLDGRTPEQLAEEGLVAVKYVPKNSNQPFQFARSAMPDDPENWVAVPRELVGGLQRFHKQFVDDQGLATIGAIWNSVHRLWKGSVTVLRPAFYVNNGIGGLVNNVLADVTDPSAYTDAFRATFLNGKGSLATPNGSISYADAMRMMERTGVIDAGLSKSLLKAPTLAEVTGKKGLIGRAADAGAAVEKFNRASIFFDRLKKGATAEEAALDTLAAHFDYSDEALTEVERRVREFVPFYIWMKNNAEYQVKKFLEKPQVYGAYVRARERLSEEGRDERPTWQRNSLPTGLRIDGQEIRGTSNDPIADVLDLLEKPADKLTGAGTPLIKEPLQQIFNKDLYTGRPVSEYPGDVAPFGTGYMNARLAHALKSLGGPFATIGDVGPRIAAGQGTPKDITALIRLFVPGIQAVDPNARLRENAAKVRERIEQDQKAKRERVLIERKKEEGR